MTDEEFFASYPDRQTRIRMPAMTLEIEKDRQRSVRYLSECEREFQQLGDHQKSRRRIVLWRVPEGNPWYDPLEPKILKIPMLAYADESISNDDATLLPIIHGLMQQARQGYA